VTAEQIVGLVLAGLVMLVGLAGTVIPGIPGAPLVFIAAVGHRLYFGAASADYWILFLLALLAGLSLLFEYLAGVYGARKLGATWRGMTGAVVGAIVGLFFGLPGILLGPFLGALLFEWAGGYPFQKALRAGVGAFIGLIAGGLGKIAICVVMITLFFVGALYRSLV